MDVSQVTVDQRFLASVDLRVLVYTCSPFPLVGGTQGLHWPAGIVCSAGFQLSWHLPASAGTGHGLEGDLHNYLFRQWLYSHTASGLIYQSGVGALFDLTSPNGEGAGGEQGGSLVPLHPFPLSPRCSPLRRQPTRVRK